MMHSKSKASKNLNVHRNREVFFEDWKLPEGWGRFALQYDEEGVKPRPGPESIVGLRLCIRDPEQSARIKDNLPACTVGNLKRTSQMDALVEAIRGVVNADNPHQKFNEIIEISKNFFHPGIQ